jgi:hypothetical protein
MYYEAILPGLIAPMAARHLRIATSTIFKTQFDSRIRNSSG